MWLVVARLEEQRRPAGLHEVAADGEDEIAAGEVTVRDLHDGEQARVAPADVSGIVAKAQNAQWLRQTEHSGIGLPDWIDPDA